MNLDEKYFVYILCDKPYGTLYIGVTNNLPRRMHEHKSGTFEGFSKKYRLKTLVYYEGYANIEEAIAQEKRMKHWLRQWKIDLIHSRNRDWRDLTDDLNN